MTYKAFCCGRSLYVSLLLAFILTMSLAFSIHFARFSKTEFSIISFIDICTQNVSSISEIIEIASRLSPPHSKKSSVLPISSSCKYFSQIFASFFSVELSGSTYSLSFIVKSGTGRFFLSVLPLAVIGIVSSLIK